MRERVVVRWPGHGRDGWVGQVVGYQETMLGPMVEVEFGPHERGLYQHEYLGVVLDGTERVGELYASAPGKKGES